MTKEYIHAELGEEVQALSGYYVAVDEIKVPYKDKEVLCLIGEYVTDGWCCGRSESRYAQVAGYVVEWKSLKSDNGTSVSMVEPINHEREIRELSDIIKGNEFVRIVEFL